jgi:ligand-binding sensor domain-containing protein
MINIDIILRQLKMITFLLIMLNSAQGQIQNSNVKNEDRNLISSHPFNVIHSIDKNIRSIFQDRNGNYWVGTNGAGVYRFDTITMTQFTVKDGLADNQVINIQEDTFGNLWFGSGTFAISKFDGTKITSITYRAKTSNDPVTAWQSNNNNNLWFYAGGGAFNYSHSSLDYWPFAQSSSNTETKNPYLLSRYGVYCILKDKQGNIWFGTQAEGVCRYDGNSLTWFKEKGLAGPAVLGLFEDSKGIFWFGNNGAGLFKYDGKVMTNFTEEKGLNNADFLATSKPGSGTLGRVYCINEDNDGNIWIGTVDTGVWKYDGNILTNYTTKDGLTSNAVNTIYKDKKGALWFGTDSNGICKFNGMKFTEFVFK